MKSEIIFIIVVIVLAAFMYISLFQDKPFCKKAEYAYRAKCRLQSKADSTRLAQDIC